MNKEELREMLRNLEKRRYNLLNILAEKETELKKIIDKFDNYSLTKNNSYFIDVDSGKIMLKREIKKSEKKKYIRASKYKIDRLYCEIIEKLANNYPLNIHFVSFMNKILLNIVFYIHLRYLIKKIDNIDTELRNKAVYDVFPNLDYYEKETEEIEKRINELKMIAVMLNEC